MAMDTVVVPIQSIERADPLITAAAMLARSIPASIDIVLTSKLEGQEASVRQVVDKALNGCSTGVKTTVGNRAWPQDYMDSLGTGQAILVFDSEHSGSEEDDLRSREWCGPTLLVPEMLRSSLPATPKHILVALTSATDESARRTLPFATRLALDCDASLAITVVLPLESEISSLAGDGGADTRRQHVLRRINTQRYLDKVTANLRARGIRATWETRNGSPVDEIVRLAETTSPDLIVMSPTAQSMAGQIANRSGRPVILSRPSESQPAI